MATDGLVQLVDQRARRTGGRGLPPPQHRKAEPATGSEPAAVSASEPPTEDGIVGVVAPTLADEEQSAHQVSARAAAPAPNAEPIGVPRRRSRVRPTQVHLDDVSEEHLTELRKRAVMADVDLTQSAVVRMALAELVDRYGYDRIVSMFADTEPGIRRGRPRH